uniref:type IX secretion system plug protein n=1 Tax=Polaribacter sp. TaxID=1920175 RepID=UPI004048BBF6
MKKIVFFSSLFLYFLGTSFAQEGAQTWIKSVVFTPTDKELTSTIVPLGTPLNFSFDDLEANQKVYQYKIEHMTFDWKPSDLLANEYIDGFQQQTIQEYDNSFNTLQDYTHYAFEIPNESLSIKKSGNYQVTIIDLMGNPVLKRRFTYFENLVQVGVKVIRSRASGQSNSHQDVEFSINYPQLNINNPGQEIKIAVLQNNNWNTAITQFSRPFYKRNQIVYGSNSGATFAAGNEFLNFDNKALSSTTLKIAKVEKQQIYHHYLHNQEPRFNKPYTYSPDINGRFLIRAINTNSSSTEADYVFVHFSLKTKELTPEKVFVFGGFNDFKTGIENQMKYDLKTESYLATLLLKQGFYNYNFVSSSPNGIVNLSQFSGSFYQTENSYTVLVYYRPMNDNYDRVIGSQTSIFEQTQ